MAHCTQYPQELISRFVDRELDPVKRDQICAHLTQCQSCADQVTKIQKLSRVFETHATEKMAKVKVGLAASPIQDPASQDLLGRIFKGMTDHLFIKLASLAGVAALLILALFQTPSQTGPSAIVKSLDTNASSVMIIETPTEKHTIIWFSET